MRKAMLLLVLFCGISATARPASAEDCYSSSIISPSPFMGNNDEVFKLADGSIWQVKYEYEYLYEYFPSVVICPSRGKLIVGKKSLNVQLLSRTTAPEKPSRVPAVTGTRPSARRKPPVTVAPQARFAIKGVLKGENLLLRSSPELVKGNPNAIARLPPGSIVRPVGKSVGQWLTVECRGRTGWIRRQYLGPEVPGDGAPEGIDSTLGGHDGAQTNIPSAKLESDDGSSHSEQPTAPAADPRTREKKEFSQAKMSLKNAILAVWESTNQLRAISRTPPNTNYVWITEVDKDSDETFVLANGGVVVKKSYGYVGYVGYHERCVVYGFGWSWNLVLKGSKYDCELVERPRTSPELAREDYVIEVMGSGRVLKMLDGRLLSVDASDVSHTSSWSGGDVLVLSGGRLLELQHGHVIRTSAL